MQKTTIKIQLRSIPEGKTITGYQAYIDTVPVVLHRVGQGRAWTVSEPRTGLVLLHYAGKNRKEALIAAEKYLITGLNRSPDNATTIKALIEEGVRKQIEEEQVT